MDKSNLTPEESLLLISKTINETKQRLVENGHIIVFWGSLMFAVSLSQYILIRMGLAFRTGLPSLLYPFGAIYTLIYVWKKHKKYNLPKTLIGNILKPMGWILGMNLLIMGFLFSNKLGGVLVPVFLIFLAMYFTLAKISIRSKPLIIGESRS